MLGRPFDESECKAPCQRGGGRIEAQGGGRSFVGRVPSAYVSQIDVVK
jgi:hypothetical protein